MNLAEESPDFAQLDDTALLGAREQMRAELQRLPAVEVLLANPEAPTTTL
jgi:hypothetical protein